MSQRSISKRSRSTSSTRRTGRAGDEAALDRPFDPAVERRARALADGYAILVEANEYGGYLASCVEFPGGFANAPSRDAAVKKLRDSLWILPATMIEMGQEPPEPAASSARKSQLNVRLSAREKARLETAARRKGFRGVSDFVRSVALENCD